MFIGEMLSEHLDALNNEIGFATEKRDDFLNAWSEKDWAWLYNNNYITFEQFESLK